MRAVPALLVALPLVFLAPLAEAADTSPSTCAAGSTCVPKADMDVFVSLLKEKHCLQTDKPTFEVDPITIVVDKDGRIYGSGTDPVPWRLHMKWCGYDVDGGGKVSIVAAQKVEPDYGFRFRVKAAMGILGVEAFKRDPWTQAVDVGVLVEPFFFRSVNVNVAVGVRSFGGGLGFDLTRNFGVYLGYAVTFAELRSNPYAGLSFSFW